MINIAAQNCTTVFNRLSEKKVINPSLTVLVNITKR